MIGFEKNTSTQAFALGLDTGLRALWEAEQDFEFTVASPTGATPTTATNGPTACSTRRCATASARSIPTRPRRLRSRGDNLDQLQGDTREMRYDANIGVAFGTSTPSSYELRFLATHFDYSDENTNKVPRTTLEGQGTWNLQLNPVLASQIFADYLHYQADNDDDTELANVDLTAGAASTAGRELLR